MDRISVDLLADTVAALLKLGYKPAIEKLISQINDHHVRSELAFALLGEFGDERVVKPMIQIFQSSSFDELENVTKVLYGVLKRTAETIALDDLRVLASLKKVTVTWEEAAGTSGDIASRSSTVYPDVVCALAEEEMRRRATSESQALYEQWLQRGQKGSGAQA